MSGFVNRLLSQFIEVIEWLDSSTDILVYRFPVNNQEIKMGAQLIVREGQAAVFINEGQMADVFMPGHYTLNTQNMPILTMLKSWKYGFNSPFKAEVYFVNTRVFTDQKWGTPNPIMLRDPEFGPVRLRAFGTYAIRVTDPGKFLRDVVGTEGLFQTDRITGQLRDLVVTHFTNALGQMHVPALDLAANYVEMSQSLQGQLAAQFQEFGLSLVKFLIENISLPPEVEAMLDKRSSMGILGDMGRFTQFEAAQALEAAAHNPGGGEMSAGLGIGAGLAMGQQMAQNIQNAQAATQQASQPTMQQASQPVNQQASQPTLVPTPPAQKGVRERLAELKGLLDDGLIGEDDFNQRKAQILADV
ncbi:MAG TPA: SPFH domain-containing protein [Armatimonadota bacterium]|nr:SPFH domain-containing protein [Armatimonadota bacterium]